MDGNNMDIKNLDNILFSNTEVKYLNKIYKTVPRKYMPKKPEAVRDLQALNRAILDKQKTVNKGSRSGFSVLYERSRGKRVYNEI